MEEAAYNQQCAELEKIAKVPWNCEKKKGKKKRKNIHVQDAIGISLT